MTDKSKSKSKKKPQRVLLIDADWVAFKMAAAFQFPCRWDDGVWTPFVREQEVFEGVDGYIEYIKQQTKGKQVYMCLSDSVNWRKDVMPSYKSNRKNVERPLALGATREYIAHNYQTLIMPRLEADDVMGIYATDNDFHPGDMKIVVSIDKDLKQIPSYHYNPEKDFQPWQQDTHEGDKLHYIQWLAGDPTDGYSGCAGIGLGTAKQLMDAEPTKWEAYEHTFKSGARKGMTETRYQSVPCGSRSEQIQSCFMKAGHTLDECIQAGMVSRILRHGEYDKETQAVTYKPFEE